MCSLSRFAAPMSAALLVAMVAAPLQAQRKPDPPSYQQGQSYAPDLDRFADAYERAGSPTIAVVVEIASSVKDAVGEGPLVRLFDTTGDSYLLRSAIEEQLRLVPDVDLVNVEILRAMDKRDVELLRLGDEREAMELLGTRLGADSLLVVRLQPTGQDALYRVVVESLDVARGRTLDTFPFDWEEGADAVTIKEYARAITRRYVEGFDRAFSSGRDGTARRFTLKLVGISDLADLKHATELIEDVPGVDRVKVSQRQANPSANEAVSELTVTFRGSAFDLAYEVQQAARQGLDMDVSDTDVTAGTITLIARGASEPTGAASAPALGQSDERRWRSLEGDGARSRALRQQVRDAYQAAGSPRIAVLVSRALSESELSDAALREELQGALGSTIETQTNVVITIAGDDAVVSTPGAPGQSGMTSLHPLRAAPGLETDRLENQLVERFARSFGFTLIDPKIARSAVLGGLTAPRRFFDESQVLAALREQKAADIVVLGAARPEFGRRQGQQVVYTFRAVRLSDGVILASSTLSRDAAEIRQSSPEQPTAGTLAAELAGRLADQMWLAWSPPSSVTLIIENAGSERNLLLVSEALRANVPALRRIELGAFDPARAGGRGELAANATATREELLAALDSARARLPFEIDRPASVGGTIVLRLTE